MYCQSVILLLILQLAWPTKTQADQWLKDFEGQLVQSVSGLDAATQKAVSLLRENVLSVGQIDNPHVDIPLHNLEQGYIAFVEKESPELVTKVKKLKSGPFKEQMSMSKKVGELFFYSISATVADPMKPYLEKFVQDPSLIQKVNQNTADWLINIKICEELEYNWPSISDFVYSSLLAKKRSNK